MKRAFIFFLHLWSVLVFFSGCTKENTFDCIKSTGDIKKEDRYFDDFSLLYVEDNINVVLMQDMPGKVVLEAGENLLPKIKIEQNGNALTIRNNNTCNWVRSYDKPINVYVGVNQVKEVSQTGYGTIKEGEYLKTDTIRIYCLTFGETNLTIEANFVGFMSDDHATVRLKGKAKKLAGGCYRNGLVNTEEMKTPFIFLTNKSIVEAIVYSDSLLQADIYGDGNIVCKGKPSLVEYHYFSGKGTLITQ